MAKNQLLSIARPDLVAEWNYDKNGDKKPENYTCGSRERVWWKHNYRDEKTEKEFLFEWDAPIADRVKYSAVPFLTNHRVWPGYNDLATLRPDLAEQFHPTKNGNFKPTDFSLHSTKKVWWLLKYKDCKTGQVFDFEWEETIGHRTNGNQCPYLSGHKVWKGFNDVETLYPDLIKNEWDFDKNEKKPSEFTSCSCKKVWWKLPYFDEKTGKTFVFEWEATIQSRVKGAKCPYLTGNKVWVGYNDLATTHPALVKEWDFEKNTIKPTEVTAGSRKKVWWCLSYFDEKSEKTFDFRWDSTVANRTIENQGCPYLTGRRIYVGYNDLASTHPEVLKSWDFDKNKIKPTEITAGSEKKVWWVIDFLNPKTNQYEKYSWKTMVCSRVNGCIAPLSILSHAERLLYSILIEHKIDFKPEHSFCDCFYTNKLKCDTYIPKHDAVIECDGIQHFQDTKWGKDGQFEKIIIRDNIKNNYCIKNNIPLLRIPYIYDAIKDRDKIESFILCFLKTKKIPQEIIDFYSQFEFSNYVKCVTEYHKQLEKTVA